MGKTFVYNVLSPGEQVRNMEQKGVVFEGNDKKEAEFFFVGHSHFKVNYHRQRFQEKREKKYVYQQGTTWSQLRDRYQLEFDLKKYFFGYVGMMEATFKNILCYHTCNNLGNTRWADPNMITDANTLSSILPILASCQEFVKGNVQNVDRKYAPIIKNYGYTYDDPPYPPFWNIMDLFTFGQIGYIYKGLADKVTKKQISNIYGMNPRQLEFFLKQAIIIRNIVYHDNHLLFYTVSKQSLTTIQNHLQKISSTLPNIVYKGFVCAVAIVYTFLEPEGKSEEFLQGIKQIFDNYDLEKVKMV